MSNAVTVFNESSPNVRLGGETEQFLTVKIESQLFGLSVLKIRDVLKPQKITPIPLSQDDLKGYMNLRGRIVPAIDVRIKLNLPELKDKSKQMFVVAEHGDELTALIVDEVLETRTLKINNFTKNPENLKEIWAKYSKGIFKLKNELMLVLDIENVVSSN